MIAPTPGRIVWYYPSDADHHTGDFAAGRPHAAIIAYVHSDRMVNLAVFTVGAGLARRSSVKLLQDGDPAPANERYCEWMPYQKGQAAKNDDLEPRVNALEAAIASGYTKP